MLIFGGLNDNGVVFSLNTTSNTFTKIKDLSFSDGTYPYYSAFIKVPIITTSSVASSYCAGKTFNLNYTSTGPFKSTNIFSKFADNYDTPYSAYNMP